MNGKRIFPRIQKNNYEIIINFRLMESIHLFLLIYPIFDLTFYKLN